MLAFVYSHRDVGWVDLHVGGAVDGSLCIVADDLEQRAILKLVRPFHIQRGFTESTGPTVLELTDQTFISVLNDCFKQASTAPLTPPDHQSHI